MDRAWGMCNPAEDMEGLNGMLCMRVGECVGELNKYDYGKLVTFSQKWRNWKRCKDVRTRAPPPCMAPLACSPPPLVILFRYLHRPSYPDSKNSIIRPPHFLTRSSISDFQFSYPLI